MPDEPYDQAVNDHTQYMEERKGLIDAARESARTFDQAVLAFGSAVFGASIAFLKDVAPKPQFYTLKWLGISWGLFSIGLLGALLSFLFSHKACMFEIKVGAAALGKPEFKRPKNRLSSVTDWCNYLSVGFLFLGLLSWSVFAFENLAIGGSTLNNPKVPPQPDTVKKGYVPPPPPPRTPPPTAPPSSPPSPPPTKK
jgi:hypothetical protein